ncbi:MAG TPA: hypothetical protein VGO57_02735 [Verrucomicrobiae bacterium]|jgi:hypothetical protein
MLTVVRFWILISTLLVSAGWILSGLHALNCTGYAIFLILVGVLMSFLWRDWFPVCGQELGHFARKFPNRFRRIAPLLFLVLAGLSLLSGLLYLPDNVDTNSYRIPRVLHWLGQGQWHVIHAADRRLDIAGCGWEWLSAPLLLFTGTDRCLFLINLISYLLLPGLIFSWLTRCGVRSQVAWWWMWLLPSGWCFMLQAGSYGNDTFATIYILAAVELAWRAYQKKCVRDWCLALFAAALLTGTKQTNLPLILLWGVVAGLSWRLVLANPWAIFPAFSIAALVSILPVTIFNLVNYGSWLGVQGSSWDVHLPSPFWAIVGNAFCLPAQNLLPPVFPWAESWNAAMDHFVTTPLGAHFSSFERFGMLSLNTHGINELNAGLGLGLCLLVVVTLIGAWYLRAEDPRILSPVRHSGAEGLLPRILRWLPWLLLLVFMAKVGTYSNARQLAPYYIFLFPVLLVMRGNDVLVRRRWWQWLALALMLFAAGLLVTSRTRPLFPVQTILNLAKKEFPQSSKIERIGFAFNSRASSLDGKRIWLQNNLPAKEPLLAYLSGDGTAEPALWLPFGQRRVERIAATKPADQLIARGIHYVVIDSSALPGGPSGLDPWLQSHHATLTGKYEFQAQAGQPAEAVYLVRLAVAEN